MKTKRSTYVWVIIIFMILGAINSFTTVISSVININTLLTPSLFSNPIMNMIYLGLGVVEIWLLVVYLFKLYDLKEDVIKWTHIIFGFTLAKSFFSFLMVGGFGILIFIPWIIGAIIVLIIWKTFVKHLKKIQKNNI